MRENGLVRVFFSLAPVLVLMAICPAYAVAAAQEQPPDLASSAPEVHPSEIAGTIRINGWTGDASQIRVYTMPGAVVPRDGRQRVRGPLVVERSATLTRTDTPNEFRFSIKRLNPHTTYRIGIEFPPNPVLPKVFWRGLMGGIAISGGPPVALEGFVACTQVEILDSQRNWVGADDLQFTNPETAVRSLRWRSTLAGVVAGELQISTRAFPIKGAIDPCAEPVGSIIYRQQLPGRGGDWQETGPLDFAQILRPGRTLPPTDQARPGILPMGQTASDSSPTDDRTRAEQPSDVSPISDRDLSMLDNGAPLYVRVVPILEGGSRACNVTEQGVHGWVILAKLKTLDFEIPGSEPVEPNIEAVFQNYTPPRFPDLESERHPNMSGDSGYYVIKDHKLPPCRSADYACRQLLAKSTGLSPWAFSWKYSDWIGQWYLVNEYDLFGQALVDNDKNLSPNMILPKGTKFHFIMWVTKTSSCSGLCVLGEVFSNLVTGAINGFGDFLTYVAEGYESIKEGVITVVADVVTNLPGIGDACNLVTKCEDVIRFGVETGLASMGLPPSLPNWNEIKDQGMEYLAAEIASEMASTTGLPQEVAQLAADETMNLARDMAQKTIDAMTRNQGSENGPQYDWVLPYMGMDPAVWTIWVKKKEGVNLPSNLYLRTRGDASFLDLHLSANPFGASLYIPGQVHVPTEFPTNAFPQFSNIIKIPIVLQPDFSTIPPPKCYQIPGYSITCLPNPNWLNIPQCATSNGSGLVTVNCEFLGWSNYIGVYYRDYWIENRLDTYGLSDCFWLKARADTNVLGLWLPYSPPFHAFAAIPADEELPWDEPFYVGPGCN